MTALLKKDDTPAQRLERLLSIITSVIASYAATPIPSPLHLTELTHFYQRAASLSPKISHGDPAPPSPPGMPRSKSVVSLSFLTNPFNGSPPMPRIRNDSLPPSKRRSSGKESDVQRQGESEEEGPTERQVEQLEKEWWTSEIVAAWYGPRQGYGLKSQSQKSNGGRSVNFRTLGRFRRDVGYVGLDDE
ncbi:hypothetical protein L202_07555 [Cryptococcus amylolentus CBS 6039]|uniref:Uncharacterized protein n=2 Tax=Cryptococcus amylolentus TaxID=104669 RepID=A0A1E3HDA1_9TREE|nr:hypothetical protein L202_07555 [Cryptococcus amylolentus CBS 6039]ODN74095.1 hypothetical protein L202_07555 [Cryptococcus amylolentus CBS 6039]ODO00120.1 hypothetical protein I350_06745 [Cryptococcus amylolentus CBS 6273]